MLATSLEAALAFARRTPSKRGVDEIMVIGGSDVFAATMPLADRLEITHVHASPQGDSLFPPIDPDIWQEDRARSMPPARRRRQLSRHVTYVRRRLKPRSNLV